MTFTILLFDSGVCLSFNNRNALNLKRNHKSNREKSKLTEREQILRLFPEKKISKTYIRVLTTFNTLKKNMGIFDSHSKKTIWKTDFEEN